MTISATYIQLQRAIADELGDRQDLLSPLSDSNLTLSPIQNAIASAIAKWEREPFYFNEVFNYSSPLFTTVNGQEFYTSSDAAAIATGPYILKLHVLVNANRYPLEQRTWQYVDEISANPAVTGMPCDWAYFAEQIRLYPVPDGAYPVRASRIQRVVALSADADTNIWTQDAYDLIRSEAKLILARETLHDATIAGECELAIYGNPAIPSERGYLKALKAETTRRARAKIRPTYF